MIPLYLLSPARCNGTRADHLAVSRSPLGVALRGAGAPLGEVFSWLSALDFRGKLAYARTFAPRRTFIMAPGLGLRPASHLVTVADLRAMAVLLGSIATGKYVDTLLAVFGERLVFPATFVGRGDMSRGGLLLRAARLPRPTPARQAVA